MTESGSPAVLGYEPRAAFAQHADPAIADCQGKRIGILVVTYNALSTLIPVLKRIPPSVWSNVEEVAEEKNGERSRKGQSHGHTIVPRCYPGSRDGNALFFDQDHACADPRV